MAAQGERVSGVIGMCSCSLVDDPMVQDTPVQDIPIPEQDIVVEELELPQMDLEPEMGAAAAYDASPPLFHQNPSPFHAETAHQSAPDMAQLIAMLVGMRGEKQEMNERMQRMENNMGKKMDGMTQTMREEMQCMGAGLQEGQEQLKGEMEKNMTAVKEFKIGQG